MISEKEKEALAERLDAKTKMSGRAGFNRDHAGCAGECAYGLDLTRTDKSAGKGSSGAA